MAEASDFKSFLVLFFKKERLPSLLLLGAAQMMQYEGA
jgi:hypothetical protein